MKCEGCNCEHDSSYGSGRFCSQGCARSFSTREKRKEINEKVSKKLRKNNKILGTIPCPSCNFLGITRLGLSCHYYYKHDGDLWSKVDWTHLTWKEKRNRLLKESNYTCSDCGFNKTRPDGKCILEIDHIDGDYTNNDRSNLRVLCPNCHAMTPNYKNFGNKNNNKRSTRIKPGNKEYSGTAEQRNRWPE